MTKLGEGRIRMNKATNFLIAQARNTQRMWGLSDYAVERALEDARNAISADRCGKTVDPYGRDERRTGVWLRPPQKGTNDD